jgi:hypothetical protein
MDRKKINEEISEIRSLMNLNEELPYMSPVGTNSGIGLWQGIKNFFNPEDAEEESVFHRQTFVETGKDGRPIGYFVPNMMVGKCYEYSKINISDPVWKIMGLDILGFVPGEDLFEDEDGAYIKPSPDSPVRVYLPKQTWFKQFSDCIFTIKEVTECDKPNSSLNTVYRLLFQLKDPNAAIKSLQITKDGIIPVGSISTDNRGWDVYSTFKSSGYFNVKNTGNIQESIKSDKIINEQETAYTRYLDKYYGSQEYLDNTAAEAAKKIENEKKEKLMRLMGSNPITSLEEYSWEDIEEKSGRSDFDIWYDSSSGTLISIGIAILLGVLTGGLSVSMTAAMTAGLARTAARVTIVVLTEAIIGVPEALYLHDRGMDSQAGLIIFMCLIPAFGELGRFNKLLKKPATFDDAIDTLVSKYTNGEMKTPAQFKQWLDGLKASDSVLYEYLKKVMPLAQETAEKSGTKTIEKQIFEGLSKVMKTIDGGDLTKAYKLLSNVEKKLLQKAPSTWPYTLKNLGFTLGMAGVSGIIFVVFFSSDSELGKPSELKSRIDKGISAAQVKLGQKNTEPITKKIKTLQAEIDSASRNDQWDLFYKKTNELLLIYKDLCRMGVEDTIVPTKLLSDTIFNAYQTSLYNYAVDVQKEQSGVVNSVTVPVLNQDASKQKILNSRQDLPNADSAFFISKEKVCEFISWCYLNYNTSFQWYMDIRKETKSGEVKITRSKFSGVYGGKTPPDQEIAKNNILCDKYLNPTDPNSIKFGLSEFLGHPFMKCLWSQYGLTYKGTTKNTCNKPGFVQITKSSEIGAKDETKYEYCSYVDQNGITLYYRKPK